MCAAFEEFVKKYPMLNLRGVFFEHTEIAFLPWAEAHRLRMATSLGDFFCLKIMLDCTTTTTTTA